MHTRIDFDLRTDGGRRTFRTFLESAADLVVSLGGSLSGEHGDGQALAELLPRMYGEELVDAFRQFKSIWDPDWKMNPGKVVDPYRLDEDLKLGADYNPWRPKVKFSYGEDKGDFENTDRPHHRTNVAADREDELAVSDETASSRTTTRRNY